ncbi:FAD-dependent oxidoreductase [Duganella sp. LX20W]|uniref:FAD-dependent oxidoreductase n=1 Tax=Rugamonas brunnea TaxID=2758569 RepID=A0A7W2IDK8_9BURK|nr:FAD-binding oxidoreductase [Rugamonas brunnea]MBA5639087.1 FAD-dependent oxidoreductase [Rugamonas brunnea]
MENVALQAKKPTALLRREQELTQGSYYEASVRRPVPDAPLVGRTTADVCVIGAGLAGLSAALELRARGLSVVVLEAQTVGWGASGRNGGQALVGYASDDAVEQQLPPEQARQAWQVTVDALALLRRRIAAHDIDCDFVDGYLSMAVNARKGEALRAYTEQLERDYGYVMQPIAPDDVGAWIDSERFHSGVYDPQSGHLHPLKYCLGLARAVRAAGARIYEHAPVVQVQRGARPVVRTASGEVACDFVVMAGNVYLNEYGKAVAPDVGARIMPVGTYIIATAQMEAERANALIRQRAAVCDTNFVLDYFRLTADNRLLFGGGVSYTGATPANLRESMRRRMLAVFPQLADLKVPHAWGGFVDITMNRGPDFGRVDGNLYYLQGFSGHGLALTGMAGLLAAEAIAGQAGRFDLLSQLRHRDFPGGPAMRTPALVLGTLYHRLRDLL